MHRCWAYTRYAMESSPGRRCSTSTPPLCSVSLKRGARRRAAAKGWCGRLGCMVFLFDDLELDTSLFELRRGGVRVSLEPQVFSVLAYLVAHRDRVVSKEELMDEVWGGRFVSETAVRRGRSE